MPHTVEYVEAPTRSWTIRSQERKRRLGLVAPWMTDAILRQDKIVAQMYVERKQWDLQNVHVDVRYERVLSPDGSASGAAIGMIDQFEMHVCFSGDLSEEQRGRLLGITNRCPIHRIVTSDVKIHSRLLIPDVSPR